MLVLGFVSEASTGAKARFDLEADAALKRRSSTAVHGFEVDGSFVVVCDSSEATGGCACGIPRLAKNARHGGPPFF